MPTSEYIKAGGDKLSFSEYHEILQKNYLFFKDRKENSRLVEEKENKKLFNLSLNQIGKNFSNNFIKMLNDAIELIDKYKTNFKGVGQPLRIALTGSKFGPGLYNIILSLDKSETIKRLKMIY